MTLINRFLLSFTAIAIAITISGVASAGIKVGLVLDRGGKDDKSFNAAAFAGASRAAKELGIELKTVEAMDNNAFEPPLRAFAQRKYDLIIGVGISQQESVNKVASQFPNSKFAIVDAEVDLKNVRALLFQEHEGSYLVGAIAAMKSTSGKIGFIGGMDIPLIRRFQMGYEAGAKAVNPKIKVESNYVGVTPDAWNNPAKGKELAVTQYEGGADVIFAAAGGSGMGLFDAAEEKNKFAIGVDSNQNWIKPGKVLTSMLKRVDVAVFNAIKDATAGKFTAGVVRHGLQNEGVDYALDQYNEKLLSADLLKKVNTLKSEIIAGKIKVPDYYKRNAKN